MAEDFYNTDSERTSHKVIEKRRRDRINNCLMELSQTVPSVFAKQTTGKLEKAEILEMTVDYLQTIQRTENRLKHDTSTRSFQNGNAWADFNQHYQLGYNECMREVIHYMTDIEGLGVNDSRCVRILSYLQTRLAPNISLNNTDFTRTLRETKSECDGVRGVSIGRGFRRYSPYRTESMGDLRIGSFMNKPSRIDLCSALHGSSRSFNLL